MQGIGHHRRTVGATLGALALASISTARAQQLPPSLPLTQAFGAPADTGGAPNSAVVLTLPFAGWWRSSAPAIKKRQGTAAPATNGGTARVDTGLRTSWAVGASLDMAEAHAVTGNAQLDAPLLGSDRRLPGKPSLTGGDSYLTMDSQPAPASTLGMDLRYGLLDRSGRGLSIDSTLGMARYATNEPRRPIGVTHLKLTF